MGVRDIGIEVYATNPIKFDKLNFLLNFLSGFADDFFECFEAFFPRLSELFKLSFLG